MNDDRRPAVRPRVAHLDHTAEHGGAELALVRMLRAAADWAPAVVLAPQPGGEVGVFAQLPPGVRVGVVGIRQPAGASRGGLLGAVRFGARLLWQALLLRGSSAFRGAELLDANTARAAGYTALAARTSRKPLVVHLRDLVDAESLGAAGHALMTRVVLPRADGVIANSRATLESARPHLRAGALAEVIPSASGLRPVQRGVVGAAEEAGDVAGRAARADGLRTVGLLARIAPWKGQSLLLEAFAVAFADRDDVRLQFAGAALFGDDDELERLRARARELGLADRVDLLGQVDDVEGLLAGWDVAVQASLRPEPLGQNVLQYLAAGCAVVATDEGGPAEWVVAGENGLLVPPRDVDALADALRRLDRDDALRARLAAAAPVTPGLLDDAAVARAHADFYRRVLARRG